MRWTVSLAVTAVVAVLPACGSGDGDQEPDRPAAGRPALTVRTTEYAYELSVRTVPAGVVEVVLDNRGREDHEAQLARVNDGLAPEAVMAELAREFYAGVRDDTARMTPVGGSHAAAPGQRARTFDRLTPGTYIVYCLVAGPDGNPHTTSGMTATFEVGEPEGAATDPPVSEGKIGMDEYRYDLPPGFDGRGVFEVANRGERVHQFALLAPKPGRTVEDVRAYLERFEGEPPFVERAGMGALAPGKEAYLELDLPQGDHLAVCLMPVSGAQEPTAHFARGQQVLFRVA